VPARSILLCALLSASCADRSQSGGGSTTPAKPPAPATLAAPPTPAAPAAPGTIEGVIRFTGKAPPPLQVSIPGNLIGTCADAVDPPSALIGPEGGLAEVVVWLSGATGPLSAAPPPPVLDQRGCVFRPRVLAAAQGAELTLLNSDPLMHNVRTTSGSPRHFNTAMPLTGMKVRMPLASTPAVVRLTCDVHPWMQAFVRTFDHPFFAVSDERGRFTIRGAPTGKASLLLWHPFLGERSAQVEVPEGGVARLQIDWTRP